MCFVKYFGFEKSYTQSFSNPIGVSYAFILFFSIIGVTGSCFKTSVWRLCVSLFHKLLSYYHWKNGDILPKCL